MRISDWSSDVCSSDLLRLTDDLGFGSDYGLFQSCQVVGQAAARLSIPASVALQPAAPGCLNPALGGAVGPALGASAPALLGGLARLYGIADVGVPGDRRSEERRGGKEGVSTCRSRWSPAH